ncbi:MAG: response regulator transcription factor [Gammaproteobacteria bacterium]|nr:response regulator transcription factor [Gammaproteobacteria bacterium]MBT5203685.1 response regulator transcription factor [Gammaproteobacteria bacterium]MBT5601852.1 response regulator transcription factor [Gammaproteobacteria bacterium]MBT6246109.1 response regulator transcription factor [Gammaproteobacteria bacterium]
MKQILISSSQNLIDRWRCSFSDNHIVACVEQAIELNEAASQLIFWLDLGGLDEAQQMDIVHQLVQLNKLVIMSAVPSQVEASRLLRAGAMGYCHAGAAAVQLAEIATVVEHDGFWMPREMVQKFVRLTRRVKGANLNLEADPNNLTDRERVVAEQVGLGANNSEIAGRLNISERTVKAHLSSIFQQLGVRDRVQLALVINNLPVQGDSGADE